MAGLKKKKREKSSSPNVVLVIFLVFFFLLAIGLGIWGYYGYAGQDDLKKQKFGAEASAKGEKTGKRFYALQYRYIRTALGDSLSDAESGQMNEDLDEMYKENGGVFKDEPDLAAARTLLEDLKRKLGTAENNRDFKTTYAKDLKAAQDEATEWKGKAAAAVTNNERMEKLSSKLTKERDEFFKKVSDRIEKDNTEQLVIVKQQSEAFKQATEQNKKLTEELEEKKTEKINLEEDYNKALKAKDRQIAALKKDLQEMIAAGGGGGAMNVGRSAGDVSPLLLDISMGKPLWDQPVGKVTRVDLLARQVTINVGSAQGARPQLSFNIFGANASGRAEKQLKGSIQIIKVIDTSTSLARITSLYDSEGREILMNLQTRGRILRESEAPIREGDLLFNLFWGARVAVVGYISITGEPSDSPAEQNRQMEDFLHLLRVNGMQVDAYVDLRDGQIRGNITAKTRYLIRGDELRASPEAKVAAKGAEEDKDKEAGKEAPPNADRNDLINKSSRTLYNEARERGLLLISAENFATVIGYRRARNGNSTQISNFRPSLPYAGSGEAGVFVPRPKDEEKKAPENDNKAEK
jgi:hypothetical protein